MSRNIILESRQDHVEVFFEHPYILSWSLETGWRVMVYYSIDMFILNLNHHTRIKGFEKMVSHHYRGLAEKPWKNTPT